MIGRLRRLAASAAVVSLALAAGASGISADSTRDRTISFYGVNTKETVTVQYVKNGKRIPEAMQKINWALRDWRRDEATEMDPELIDLIWEIHAELGSKEPIHVISAFRSRGTNDMLRRTVGGQASESRHILGKAMDVQFPDVPVRTLRYSALIRERGGVGYYPTSATPFVHIDTDRVRAWPRLPRAELALLFPKGRTEHLPSDGGPISPEDVRRARAGHTELAAQISEFHQLRTQPKTPVMVAALTPSLPQLQSLPKLVERLPGMGTRPSDTERARLSALAAEPMPRLVAVPAPAHRPAQERQWGETLVASADPAAGSGGVGESDRKRLSALLARDATFVPAPAYDEEHPEELSYRPFPIAPFLTATSSADDPALARLVHPDLGKALEMILDHAGSAPPMRLRPGTQTAQMLWAQQFRGEAINLSSLIDQDGPRGLPTGRRVITQAQK
ncbi:MAG TPA: DUF882 domain-containing protein [Hyphomicrobiaceae bacterium]